MAQTIDDIDDDHIPAPADHAPRKNAVQQADHDLLIFECEDPNDAWVMAYDGVVEVTR